MGTIICYNYCMRFGICAAKEKAALAKDAGYDYIELGAASEFAPEEDDTLWAERRKVLLALPLPTETFNVFLRGFRLTGSEGDFDYAQRFVRTLLRRMAEVGGKVVVFGSSGVRNVPEGFPMDKANEQIERFLEMCAEEAQKNNVIVAIEPLNKGESNIINLVSEGAAWARKINHPHLRNLADSYHMEKENEPVSAIVESKDVLAHVHTADTDRVSPGTNGYDHVALFRALREANYDERISIECAWKDFTAEIAPSLAHLKQAYTEANR
jgi:sugar phosphate isomerase/epimerase